MSFTLGTSLKLRNSSNIPLIITANESMSTSINLVFPQDNVLNFTEDYTLIYKYDTDKLAWKKLSDITNVVGDLTIENTTTTNKLAVINASNLIAKSDLIYSDILRLSTNQTITGVKTFSNNTLLVSQTVDNTTTTNKLAVFTGTNIIDRTDLTYSDILRLSTNQTITGVKTFSNNTLLVSQTADDTTVGNKIAFFNATNVIQRGSIIYSDIMRLGTAQTITAQKTFNENQIKLVQALTTGDTTGTNLLLVSDSSRQVRWSDLTYSDILRLSTNQTITGVKTFSNNTLIVSQTADNTTTTNKLAMFTSGNIIDRSDLTYSDILRLSTNQTVTGIKTFSNNTLIVSQTTDNTTTTNKLAMFTSGNIIDRSDLVYSDIMRLGTAQTVTAQKTFNENTIKMVQAANDTTDANKLLVADASNQVRWSGKTYADIRHNAKPSLTLVSAQGHNLNLQTADTTTGAVTLKFPPTNASYTNSSLVTYAGNDSSNIYTNFLLQYNKTTNALSFVANNDENVSIIRVGAFEEYTTIESAVARGNTILTAQYANNGGTSRNVLIQVMPGTYAVVNPIIMQPGMAISGGEVLKQVIIVGTVSNQPIFSMRPESSLSNMTIVGNKTQQAIYFREHETESNSNPTGIYRVQVVNALRFIEAEMVNSTLGYFVPRIILNECFFVGRTNIGTVQYDKIVWAKNGAYLNINTFLIFNTNTNYTDIGVCYVSEGKNSGNGSTFPAFESTIFVNGGIIRFANSVFTVDNNATFEINDVKCDNINTVGVIGANGTTSTLRMNGQFFNSIQDPSNSIIVNNTLAKLMLIGCNIVDIEQIKYTVSNSLLYNDVFSHFFDNDDSGYYFRGMTVLKPGFRMSNVTSWLGDAYCRDLQFFSTPNDTTFTNVKNNLSYRDNVNFTFSSGAVGQTLYVGGTEKFSAFYMRVATGLTAVDSAKIIPEYWNGTAWTTFRVLTTSIPSGFRIANTMFPDITGSSSDLLQYVRFGPMQYNWVNTNTVNSITGYYWVRFRIGTALTSNTLAIEKLKVLRDLTAVHGNGHIEYFGKARSTRNVIINQGQFITAASALTSSDVYYSTNLYCGGQLNTFPNTGTPRSGCIIAMHVPIFDNTFPIILDLYLCCATALTATTNAIGFNIRYTMVGDSSQLFYFSTSNNAPGTQPTTGARELTTGTQTFTQSSTLATNTTFKCRCLLYVDTVLSSDQFIFIGIERINTVTNNIPTSAVLIGMDMVYTIFSEGEQISTTFSQFY